MAFSLLSLQFYGFGRWNINAMSIVKRYLKSSLAVFDMVFKTQDLLALPNSNNHENETDR